MKKQIKQYLISFAIALEIVAIIAGSITLMIITNYFAIIAIVFISVASLGFCTWLIKDKLFNDN